MSSFEGRTALVTGGSRGIGLGIAQSLVDRGAKVVLTARKPEALAEAVEQLGGSDVAVAVAGNAGDAEHRAAAVRTAIDTFGSLDVLVGNVGINPVYGPMMDLDLGAFRKILDTNVVSVLDLVQQAWRAWMSEHGGSVLFVASVAGLRSSPMIGGYGVSKAALDQLTRTLAVELAPRIRVNAVAPGGVATGIPFPPHVSEAGQARLQPFQASIPTLATAEQLAASITFLLSDDGVNLNGVVLPSDGGWSVQ